MLVIMLEMFQRICKSLHVPLIVFLVCSTVVHGQTNGPIRLWRSGSASLSHTSGHVQAFVLNQWGNICGDADFGLTEATVICHQLGYTGASNYSRASSDTFGTDTSPTVLSSVDCSTSSYLVILECSYDSTPPSSCTDSDDVSVTCFSTRIWDNPYDGQIRLTGGTTVNQGLVEVYCSGQWGTVCDDAFGQNDADTICRQLGYYSAFDYDHLSIQGISSQPIWLDDVPCSSPKPCIGDCVSSCPVTHNCGHSEDITISCYSPDHYNGTTENTCENKFTDIQNGPIRLSHNGSTSPSYTSGLVQLVYNRQWGNINDCSFSFTLTEATVICHQLGYVGASSYSRAAEDWSGIDTSNTVISDVRCSTPDYLVILQCTFSSFTSSCSNDSNDIGVGCYSDRIWNNPYAVQVRLTGGATSNQGLVEVYCSGQWGTVCNDGFGQNDADTVCRQLGYYSAFRYDHLSIRGNSGQPIRLSNVQCFSTQSCLSACVNNNCPSSHSCDHSEDITIECHSLFRFVATTTSTCVGASSPPASLASVNIGAIVGGIIGGIVILVVSAIILSSIIKKRGYTFLSCSRVNCSTARQTATATSTRSEPTQPQQPPAAFTLPRPEAAGSTFTYSYNQPTDSTITAAPPPAYGLRDNFVTYNEEQSDLPPPSYSSETRPSFSLPSSAPPLYTPQSYPPSLPP